MSIGTIRHPWPLTFPFAAVVGMEWARKALLLLAIDPPLKGVLIAAELGTGKSVLARSFPWILPSPEGGVNPKSKIQSKIIEWQNNWRGKPCRDPSYVSLDFNYFAGKSFCPKLVTVPLNVTEDRLLGGLDLKRTIITGRPQPTQGLLAQAHTGILYVDEINLLDRRLQHHIAAALGSGVVRLEREGTSAAAPADFMFIGSYDPAEGEVSPALADGVALCVTQLGALGPPERVELVTRVMAFNRDPQTFVSQYASHTRRWQRLIASGRNRLPDVEIKTEHGRRLIITAEQLGVEGNRADIFALRVARASAALHGRRLVQEDDVQTAIQLVLFPRARDVKTVARSPARPLAGELGARGWGARDWWDASGSPQPRQPSSSQLDQPSATSEEFMIPPTDCRLPSRLLNTPQAAHTVIRQSGADERRGGRSDTINHLRGRYISATKRRPCSGKMALDATLRAAAPQQKRRRLSAGEHWGLESWRDWFRQPLAPNPQPLIPHSPTAVKITKDDLRWKRFKQKAGLLIVFVVDASGSMALNRMNQAKGAVIRLLQEAYRLRVKVALISFRGDRAEVLLPPSRSIELARRALEREPVGGGTPLAAGLLTALDLAKRAGACSRGIRQTMLVLLTDGQANVAYAQQGSQRDRQAIRSELEHVCVLLRRVYGSILVMDTQNRFTSGGEGQALAEWLGGRYIYLHGSDAHAVYDAVVTVTATVNVRRKT